MHFVDHFDRKKPPRGGFLCWVVCKSRTLRKRTPPEEQHHKLINFGGYASGVFLFLRVLEGGGGFFRSILSLIFSDTGCTKDVVRRFEPPSFEKFLSTAPVHRTALSEIQRVSNPSTENPRTSTLAHSNG